MLTSQKYSYFKRDETYRIILESCGIIFSVAEILCFDTAKYYVYHVIYYIHCKILTGVVEY